MSLIPIKKGSTYYCDGCLSMHKDMEGYLYNGKPYCLEWYVKLFPKFKKEEEK